MTDYQQRFVQEYNDLVDRYLKLNRFLYNIETNSINTKIDCPIELLKEQLEVMWRYIEILWERSLHEKIDVIFVSKNAMASETSEEIEA